MLEHETDQTQGPPPFAGRQTEYTRMQQHLLSPVDRHGLVFLGRAGTGKTALLRRFSMVFDPAYIGLYLPLHELNIHDENNWLEVLHTHSTRVLEDAGFGLGRLPEKPEAGLRDWLNESYLPEFFRIIRPHRRLVWLLDDADGLLAAITDGRLPDDTMIYLYSLLEKHEQLGIVMTLDTAHENQLDRLAPLADPALTYRLRSLSAEESAELLALVRPQSDPTLAQALHQATGGWPTLLQLFVQALPDADLSGNGFKTLRDGVYRQCEALLRGVWLGLERDERLILTAVTERLYEDPLRPITADLIESWLVQTDYPLDATTIKAAVRSLEYDEVLHSDAEGGIQPTGDLLRRWLLENARLEDTGPAMLWTSPRTLLLALLGLMALLLLLAAAAGLLPPP